MKKLLSYFRNLWCKHPNKVETFIYLPDRYIQYHCPDCGREIYEGMDNN